MEAELTPRLQLMYFIESRPVERSTHFVVSLGLRNVGSLLLEQPAVAVDVLIDNYSTTANAIDGHAWWTRSPQEWQPIGLDRTKKFHTWSDPSAVIYPGTERCVISELQFHVGDRTLGLRSARVEVFVYGARFEGCTVLELAEHDCIVMQQKGLQDPPQCAGVAGVIDLDPIPLKRYASAPVAGREMLISGHSHSYNGSTN